MAGLILKGLSANSKGPSLEEVAGFGAFGIGPLRARRGAEAGLGRGAGAGSGEPSHRGNQRRRTSCNFENT